MNEQVTPEELFEQGRTALPSWNDKGPDRETRRADAVALITRAAEAGHAGAMDMLAGPLGGEQGFDWAVRLAKMGETRPLGSALTNGDWPVEQPLAVLEAARQGEPWAQLAVGEVYGSGMEDTETGVLVATVDGAYGWLPGVPDPAAEGRVWVERAAAAGWAPASLSLAEDDRFEQPERALAHLREALGGALLPEQRSRAARHLPTLLDRCDAPFADRLAAYRDLADRGDGEALSWIADRLRLGDGLPHDVEAARALYERAAEAGAVDASRELGRMFEEGIGGPQDDTRARELYEQAAELGNDSFSRDRLAEKYGLGFYARGPGE